MEEQEFLRKYKLYAKEIFNICYGYSKNKADAEDLLQEIFLKFLKLNRKFPNEMQEKYYLIRMTINFCKNYKSTFYKNFFISHEIVESASDNKERNIILSHSILTLPKKYKDVIILFYYDSLSTKEIAASLNISLAAVKKRLERARLLLKERMEPYEHRK